MTVPAKAVAALVLLTLIRLWVAAAAPLAPDEAYYWVWSRALAAGYLDHPPMVALWIRAGTWLAGDGALGVRLLGPLSAAVGSVLLHDAAERLFPGRRAGPIAAALLNATLALGVGAVVMTPDTPLLFFWTVTLWAAARLAAGGGPSWWLVAGLATGLALASKYTAAFLPLGLGLYALWAAPQNLQRPEPWLGLVVAALVFLPVVLWNAEHGWAGFLHQGGRVAEWRPERAARYLSELLGGQVGLATPGVFALFVAGIAVSCRTALRGRDRAGSLLAALTVPGALVFLQHALGDRVQGNWPAILYPTAAVAAAGLAARPHPPEGEAAVSERTRASWGRWVAPSVVLGLFVAAAAYGHAATGWPAFPGDPVARQLFGWDGLAARVETARRAAGADYVAVEPYGAAAQLARLLPPPADVVGPGAHWVPMDLARAAADGRRGLLLRPARYGDRVDPALWREAAPLPDLSRVRDGVEVERYRVFLVRAAEGVSPGAVLPRR